MTPTVADYVQFFSSGPGFVLLVFSALVAFGGYCGVVGWHPFVIRKTYPDAIQAERERLLKAAGVDYLQLAKVVNISDRRRVS